MFASSSYYFQGSLPDCDSLLAGVRVDCCWQCCWLLLLLLLLLLVVALLLLLLVVLLSSGDSLSSVDCVTYHLCWCQNRLITR